MYSDCYQTSATFGQLHRFQLEYGVNWNSKRFFLVFSVMVLKLNYLVDQHILYYLGQTLTMMIILIQYLDQRKKLIGAEFTVTIDASIAKYIRSTIVL